MMNLRRCTYTLLLAGASALLALPLGAADPKDKPTSKEKATPEEAAVIADDVADIMTGYQLADFGKKHKSPEALIAAAGYFRKAALLQKKLEPIDQKPEVIQ